MIFYLEASSHLLGWGLRGSASISFLERKVLNSGAPKGLQVRVGPLKRDANASSVIFLSFGFVRTSSLLPVSYSWRHLFISFKE